MHWEKNLIHASTWWPFGPWTDVLSTGSQCSIANNFHPKKNRLRTTTAMFTIYSTTFTSPHFKKTSIPMVKRLLALFDLLQISLLHKDTQKQFPKPAPLYHRRYSCRGLGSLPRPGAKDARLVRQQPLHRDQSLPRRHHP